MWSHTARSLKKKERKEVIIELSGKQDFSRALYLFYIIRFVIFRKI